MKNWDTLEPDQIRIMNKHFSYGRGGRKIRHVTLHHMADTGIARPARLAGADVTERNALG